MIHVRVERTLCGAEVPTEADGWVYDHNAQRATCPICRIRAGVAGPELRIVEVPDLEAEDPIVLYIPMRAVNVSNARESWAARATRVARERRNVALTWMAVVAPNLRIRTERLLPCEVTLTRVAPREIDAHDALPISMKAVVDEVSVCLGLASDRDPRVRWQYTQRRGRPHEYGVEIGIRRLQ